MFVPLSFEATWHLLHPTAAKSGFLSVCQLLSLVGKKKEKKLKTCKLVVVFFPPGFQCD